MKFKNLILVAGIFAFSTAAIAQKRKVTDAAVEYKNIFQKALMKGNTEDAKKSILVAKGYIDEAAAHEDTKDDPKMNFYKGEIYSGAVSVAMQSMDTAWFNKHFEENAFETAMNAYRASYTAKKKYQYDIENSVNMKINMVQPMASKMYEDGKMEEAATLFYMQAQLNSAKDVEDSVSLNNAGLCFEKAKMYEEAAEVYEKLAATGYKKGFSYALAGSMYSKVEDYDKAEAILNEGMEKYGTDKNLLLELVKLNIAKGDNKGAETALNKAIEKDPNNKQLHFIIGTIYTDLDKNEQAEEALNKALEIDPNYLDALYNLGAHLVTWGNDLKLKVNQMKLGDPEIGPTTEKYEGIFERALPPLEKYIEADPENSNVLLILYQLHHNLGNTDKSATYKERYDASK